MLESQALLQLQALIDGRFQTLLRVVSRQDADAFILGYTVGHLGVGDQRICGPSNRSWCQVGTRRLENCSRKGGVVRAP